MIYSTSADFALLAQLRRRRDEGLTGAGGGAAAARSRLTLELPLPAAALGWVFLF